MKEIVTYNGARVNLVEIGGEITLLVSTPGTVNSAANKAQVVLTREEAEMLFEMASDILE